MKETYKKIAPGWLYQTNITSKPITYDYSYVNSRYNSYPRTEEMSKLRYNKMMEFTQTKSVLDVGYGNGSFLKYCSTKDLTCYGFDVSGYPLDPPIKTVDSMSLDVDTITFFDSLEHFQIPELWYILRPLTVKWLLISVPWCHWTDALDVFEHWKHRRPNEHFHHFNKDGIDFLLEKSGYTILDVSNVEDSIRVSSHDRENILTVVAKKTIAG